MELSHQLPRMSATARQRVQFCMERGCATRNCPAETATLRQRVVGGSVAVHLQCDGCGKSLSGSLPRADHYNFQSYGVWDNAAGESFWQGQRATTLRQTAGLIASVEKERSIISESYARWLRDSPEWAALSKSVHQRANFTCEACLISRSHVVHHMTYALGALPPAWELRAVCHGCHDRIHSDKRGNNDPWCPRSLNIGIAS